MGIDINIIKNLIKDPKSAEFINKNLELSRLVSEELSVAKQVILEKDFVSIAENGLLKVITRGDHMVQNIIIDEELLTNPKNLAINLVKCLNKNLIDITTEIQNEEDMIVKKYDIAKELAKQGVVFNP